MRGPDTSFINENVVFRQFFKSDAIHLNGAGFPIEEAREREKKPVYKRIFQAIGFEPREIGLVAYHIKEKRAIGFLLLTEHATWLYSIKYLVTNPIFRKTGIATGLLNFALTKAKNRGARKVFLNVDSSHDFAINLYTKLGFRKIVNSFEVWAQIQPLKFPIQHESKLITSDLDIRKNKILLSDICQRCMGDEWIDFFEVNSKSLIKGFSQDFKRFFSRYALINDSNDSFAMVFSRPLFKTAFVEMFTTSDSAISSMLEDLARILPNKGISYARMKLFNVNNNASIRLLEEKELYPFCSLSMGRSF